MAETQPPSNFLTPKSIDNLSIAGVSVWLICLTISSVISDLDSYWIRIIAIVTSFLWSMSLFLKNRRWNKIYNYIIILVNAVFIYINAAGINTVTRQSPFEGYGIKTELKDVKTPIVKASIVNLGNQKDWYPDYQLIKFIDTLKENLAIQTFKSTQLANEFSYIKDNIDLITTNKQARENLKRFLSSFGKSNIDSSDFAIMKSEFQFRIDSLKRELEFLKANPVSTTITTTYTVDGKDISAEDLINEYFQKNADLERKNANLLSLVRYIRAPNKIPASAVDSLLREIGY